MGICVWVWVVFTLENVLGKVARSHEAHCQYIYHIILRHRRAGIVGVCACARIKWAGKSAHAQLRIARGLNNYRSVTHLIGTACAGAHPAHAVPNH